MMTRTDVLSCIHEPFGDAFYFGPERLGGRYYGDEPELQKERADSGFDDVRYKDVVESLEEEGEGRRVFIKDITHYLLAPEYHDKRAGIAPSLRLGLTKRKGYGTSSSSGASSDQKSTGDGQEDSNGFHYPAYDSTEGIAEEDLDNPTVLPLDILRHFHFTFLIRHPRRSVPSYYRCTQPPLAEVTGFHHFLPEEAGYRELRIFFDYVREKGLVGGDSGVEIFVLDADDLLDAPKNAIEKYCQNIGLDFKPEMLEWSEGGCSAFDKWRGFHEDAIRSTGLRARVSKKEKSEEEEYKEWVEKFGKEGADVIKKTVEKNVADYEYLKQFKVQVDM